MIGTVFGVIFLIIVFGVCYKAKSKIIQLLSGLTIVGILVFLTAQFIPRFIEINESSYFTIQEISSIVQKEKNPEAVALQALIKTSFDDQKIMLEEFHKIGKAYSAYRVKYPLTN